MRGRLVSIGYPFVGDPARRAPWCLSWRYGPSGLVPLFTPGLSFLVIPWTAASMVVRPLGAGHHGMAVLPFGVGVIQDGGTTLRGSLSSCSRVARSAFPSMVVLCRLSTHL